MVFQSRTSSKVPTVLLETQLCFWFQGSTPLTFSSPHPDTPCICIYTFYRDYLLPATCFHDLCFSLTLIMLYISSTLQPAHIGLWEPILHLSSQLHIQWHPTCSFMWTTVVAPTAQKWAIATNQSLSPCHSQPLNNYQHTTY